LQLWNPRTAAVARDNEKLLAQKRMNQLFAATWCAIEAVQGNGKLQISFFLPTSREVIDSNGVRECKTTF
jgi:hypothetical protein